MVLIQINQTVLELNLFFKWIGQKTWIELNQIELDRMKLIRFLLNRKEQNESESELKQIDSDLFKLDQTEWQ